jgi:hypothetical protein
MPEDSANFEKVQKMRRIAQFFASKNSALISEDKGWRIDLVAMVLNENGGIARLRHYENI